MAAYPINSVLEKIQAKLSNLNLTKIGVNYIELNSKVVFAIFFFATINCGDKYFRFNWSCPRS